MKMPRRGQEATQSVVCRISEVTQGGRKKYNLKGSDDGVWHSELLAFWTLSIVRDSKYQNH
jgi:hypothetical protein